MTFEEWLGKYDWILSKPDLADKWAVARQMYNDARRGGPIKFKDIRPDGGRRAESQQERFNL